MAKVKRKTLTFFLFIAFFFVLAAILIRPPQPSSPPAISGSLRIEADQRSTDRFSYSGSTIDQSMAIGCDIPASLTLYISDVKSSGRVKVYINDFYVGYADINSKGDALIVSGCGCSKSCICTIKGGDNLITIVSEGFAGELTYRIYVER